jgi:hypothetical protein
MSVTKYQKYLNETINEFQNPPLVTFDEIKQTLPYDKKIRAAHNVHNGQRKLFLSEVEFLSFYYKKAKHVVYAGSADGWHTYLLYTMFNNLKFILIDPRPFELLLDQKMSHRMVRQAEFNKLDEKKPDTWIKMINGQHGIFFINDYYSVKTSEILKELPNILFISDIRTSDNDESPSDLDVIWNSAQQINWVESIKPMYYMLKFRTPYNEDNKLNIQNYHQFDLDYSKKIGFDFIDNYNRKKFEYLDGRIYLQAWAGPHSTETRLIGSPTKDGKLLKKTYDMIDYEQKLYYFNTVLRAFGYFFNEYGDKRLGFDHCHDCALENKIWAYYNQFVTETNIKTGIKTLNSVIRRNLFISGKHNPDIIHGYMFNPNKKWYEERLKGLSIPVRIDYNIPNREQKHTESEPYNYNMMIENITGKMLPDLKKKYLDYFYECRDIVGKSPILKFNDVTKTFPLTWGLKLYYTALVNFEFSVVSQILISYYWHSFKYFFIDEITTPFNIELLKTTAKILNIILIRCNMKKKTGSDEDNKKLDYTNLQMGEYYETPETFVELKISESIAKRSMVYPVYTVGKDLLDVNHSALLLSVVRAYNDIKIKKVKYYTMRFAAFLDEYVKNEFDFNHPEVLLAKKNGFDAHKLFYEDKKQMFPNGEVFLIPYGARMFFGLTILGECEKCEFIPYDWSVNNKAFYKNTFIRNFQVFNNPYKMQEYGFDCCLDCASMSEILEKIAKKNKITDVKKYIHDSIKSIFGETLKIYTHGYLFDNSDESLLETYNKETLTRISLRKKIGGNYYADERRWY